MSEQDDKSDRDVSSSLESEPSRKSKVNHAIGWALVRNSAPAVLVCCGIIGGEIIGGMGKAYDALGSIVG